MRPSLLHPLTHTRRQGRRRTGRLATLAHRRTSGKHAPVELEPVLAAPTTSLASAIAPDYDIAVRRVRAAGGPLDEACYSCECGYVFAASVSTDVCCPHCGARQAW